MGTLRPQVDPITALHEHHDWAEQARDRAIKRFFTPPEREEMDESSHRNLALLRDRVVELGAFIDLACPDGRDKVLALTNLEDSFIRASRSIFSEAL